MVKGEFPDTGLDGLNHIRLDDAEILWSSSTEPEIIWSLLKRMDRKDVVICHRGANLPMGLLSSLLRRTRVIQYHVEIYERFRIKPLRGKLLSMFDQVIFPTRIQASLASIWYHLADSKIGYLPWGVDANYFSPRGNESIDEKVILTVGQANRDYTTLAKAARASGMKLVIAHQGPWSFRTPESANVRLPPEKGGELIVGSFTAEQLFRLYQRASVVVTPLFPTVSGAGVTSLLQGFAMEKPSIVSRSPGLMEFVKHGENCLAVEPENSTQMADALTLFARDAALRASVARNGRRSVMERFNTRISGERLSRNIQSLFG